MYRYLTLAAAAAMLATPGAALACACGCGVFDVGDGTFSPNQGDVGVSIWVRDAYMDQDQNQEGDHQAPPGDNADKNDETNFTFVGGQYVVNRDWMVMAELPIYHRALTTTDDGTVFGPARSVYTGHITSVGDLQLSATYMGLAHDQSTGLTFGVKLPTGDWHGPRGPMGGLEFDRDTLPGTGSTDVMVGGYHVGSLNKANTLNWFVQARYQFAVLTEDDYRPGNELDAAAGVTWDLGAHGPFAKIAPVLQLIDSWRVRDAGANADPLNTGYERVLIAPGLEVKLAKLRFYGTVELPIYQHVGSAASFAVEQNAGQLVAPALFSLQASYAF